MRERILQFSQSTARIFIDAFKREIEAGKLTTTWRRAVPPSDVPGGATSRRPLAQYE